MTRRLTFWQLITLTLLFFTAFNMHAQTTTETPTQTSITLPAYQGYISPAPNGRYFVDEAGQGFIVIGQNDAISWPGLNTLLDGSAPEQTEAYVRDLRAHGVTVSRIMVEYAQQPSSYLENPVGEFSESVTAFWDAFIPMAEAHGLYLLLTPYDTFWQSANWDTYPYNATMGGPCAARRDWLTGRDCIEAQKNRWRFIIDRWGDSPNIFAWDLMNEIELWWEPTHDEIEAYIDEMATFVREYELERWGRSHMISVSSAAANPDGALGRLIYRHPLLDFANTHLYIGEINDPQDPILPGALMGGGVLLSLQAIEDDRPYFDSESGPINDWIVSPEFDQEYHHNMSWAHLASGGAGSGMRWPYTNPHFILPELRDNLLGLARFASTVDWASFQSRNISMQIRPDNRLILRAGCSDGQSAMIWLLADRREDPDVQIPGTTIIVRDTFDNGDYLIEYWETYEGNILAEDTVSVTEGTLELVVPDLGLDLRDLMIFVRPAG
jgi:mannan endo-1,4-beta-mannosidase